MTNLGIINLSKATKARPVGTQYKENGVIYKVTLTGRKRIDTKWEPAKNLSKMEWPEIR